MMRARHTATLLATAALFASCGGDDTDAPASDGTPSTTEHTDPATTPASATASNDAQPPAGVVVFGPFARDHVDGPVEYEQSPPVGGPHSQVWQTCQFYDTAIPNERGVHSLEHGAVWITYDPALPADQVSAVRDLADGTREVLASPHEALPAPVVASAWGVQLRLDSALDADLAAFADFYENGPQTPEADVPCAQGTTATDAG